MDTFESQDGAEQPLLLLIPTLSERTVGQPQRERYKKGQTDRHSR